MSGQTEGPNDRMTEEQNDGQTLFHRNLTATAWGPRKTAHYSIIYHLYSIITSIL